jgi:hypothetical protein
MNMESQFSSRSITVEAPCLKVGRVMDQRGIACPRCGSHQLDVYRTVRSPLGCIRRVRICLSCNHRLPTTERANGARIIRHSRRK